MTEPVRMATHTMVKEGIITQQSTLIILLKQLTLIAMSTTDTKIFDYTYGRCRICKYPFRIGDLVKIIDDGEMYSSYESAFVHFTGSRNVPYFSDHRNLTHSERKELLDTSVFKIKGVARHTSNNWPVFYVTDMANRGCVIGGDGLAPYKIYPMRKGEKSIIELEVIKQIPR